MYGWLLPGFFRMSWEDAVIDHPCMKAWMNRMHFLSAFTLMHGVSVVFFFELYMECGWNLGKFNRCFWKRTTDRFWKKSSPPAMNWKTKSCSFCLQICMEGLFFRSNSFSPLHVWITNDLQRRVQGHLTTAHSSWQSAAPGSCVEVTGKFQRPKRRVVTPHGGIVRVHHPKMPKIQV